MEQTNKQNLASLKTFNLQRLCSQHDNIRDTGFILLKYEPCMIGRHESA